MEQIPGALCRIPQAVRVSEGQSAGSNPAHAGGPNHKKQRIPSIDSPGQVREMTSSSVWVGTDSRGSQRFGAALRAHLCAVPSLHLCASARALRPKRQIHGYDLATVSVSDLIHIF